MASTWLPKTRPEQIKALNRMIGNALVSLDGKLRRSEYDGIMIDTASFIQRNPSTTETIAYNFILRRVESILETHAAESFISKQEKMMNEPGERIKYGERAEVTKLIERGFDPDMVPLSGMANSIVRKSNAVLDSRFRNISSDSRASRFTMKFSTSNDETRTATFIPGTTLVGAINGQSVLSVRLIEMQFPGSIVSALEDISDIPYLLLDIPETRPNMTMTSLRGLNTVFGKIYYDLDKTKSMTFRKMNNAILPERSWSTQAPTNIQQLTPTLYTPDGQEVNFGVDVLPTSAFTVFNTNITTTTPSYIVKTIEFTSSEVLDSDLNNKDITFYNIAISYGYEDSGTPGLFYYTSPTLDNALNGSRFVLNVTGTYTFEITITEQPRAAIPFPDNPAISTISYGIASGESGYAIVNSRQVDYTFEITSLY